MPPSVRRETIEAGKTEGYTDANNLESLERDGWLITTELSAASKKLAKELSEAVGIGEAEAIALALERKERLFMDDLKGRRTAELYKVETSTTLAIILELLATRALTVTDYIRIVKEYGGRGWISGEILNEFLERGGRIE